jgi:hypothetical protein
MPNIMLNYKPNGRRRLGRQLTRLLADVATWPIKVTDDGDDDDDDGHSVVTKAKIYFLFTCRFS